MKDTGLHIYRQYGLKREKSIYRIDQKEKSNHGWNVVVYWQKKVYTKFFSDSQYRDDPELSFEAAIKFRDKLEAQLGKPRTNRVIFADKKGIRRRMKRNTDSFEITWSPEPGKVARTSISIEAHGGVRAALQKAREIRLQKWLESLHSDTKKRAQRRK